MRVHSATDEEFGAVWDIYRSSFPADGQRSLEEQFKLFDKSNYSLLAIKKENVMGMMSVWNLYNFDFIEHFAMDEKYRNLGCGKEVMLMRSEACPTLLEVPPDSPAVKFFERCGFRTAPFEYLQPPGARKIPVKLQLMSAPMTLDEKGFSEVRDEIHKNVYGLDRPLVRYER